MSLLLRTCMVVLLVALLECPVSIVVAEEAHDARRAKALTDIREYLARRVKVLQQNEPARVATLDEWNGKRAALREQLFDMLGLFPLPPRGELSATVTGTLEHDDVVVEKLHFQSLPGLYVTASFFRPREVTGPLPTILYLAGHARTVEDGVSLGNKTAYHHHAAWFARNGYCCLMLDTLQLGEIEGIHHGTYRLGMWWWIARGYTPAGVEAWNAIRALDYLEARSEVDPKRIGVTGRSGGGAYTWFVAALDDRPACIVPVAGITDLEDHVVHDCIQGHCDCMFMVNSRGWDFGTLAALAAPRPCLLANTDKDRIFPLDGVNRVHAVLRNIYELYGAGDKLGLFITEGPHSDGQELQLAAFRWMNRWLRDNTDPIAVDADKLFPLRALKVFDELPADQRNTTIQEQFVPLAQVADPPNSVEQWNAQRDAWLTELCQRAFAAWPATPGDLQPKTVRDETSDGRRLREIEFTSEENLRLQLCLLEPVDQPAKRVRLVIADDAAWHAAQETLRSAPSDAATADEALAIHSPRGWGAAAWPDDAKLQTHMPRRFVLCGTTLDAGRIWDARRAIQLLQAEIPERPMVVEGAGPAAGIALYAALFEPGISEAKLAHLPQSHRESPILLQVLRVLDTPQTVALLFPRRVTLIHAHRPAWSWTESAAKLFSDAAPLRFE